MSNFIACPICGADFILRSTRDRHMATELPAFRARAAELQRAYEERRALAKLNYLQQFPYVLTGR